MRSLLEIDVAKRFPSENRCSVRLFLTAIPRGPPLTDDHHQLLAPRDAGVNEVPLQEQVLLHRPRVR